MWVSLCLDLNSTTFPEGCLEPVDCDKLLTIFSTPRKLAGLRGVKLAGLRLGCFLSAPFLLSCLSLHSPYGGPQLFRAVWQGEAVN